MEVLLGLIPALCQNKKLCLPHANLSQPAISAKAGTEYPLQQSQRRSSIAALNKESDSFGQPYPFLPPPTQFNLFLLQCWQRKKSCHHPPETPELTTFL